MPVYAQLESVRVFLFSVGQKGRTFLGAVKWGCVLFCFPVEVLGFWVLVSGSKVGASKLVSSQLDWRVGHPNIDPLETLFL